MTIIKQQSEEPKTVKPAVHSMTGSGSAVIVSEKRD